jgi:hypothetical protein
MPPMKFLFSAPAANAVRALCATVLLASLAACATGGPASQKETDEQALEQLGTGSVVLDCDQSCGEAWRRNRPEMMTYLKANDWRDLALLVIRTDYRQDLGYFYLGRAAEGLDEREAASGYYKTAEALATGTVDSAKCAATPDGCDGLTLLTEVLTRIQIVDADRSRGFRAARRRQNAHPASSQPTSAQPTSAQPTSAQPGPTQPPGAAGQAPTGDWVDPPPATP